jgi:hypothetical protein
MAATKYQVLYRYINEATNTPITNSMNNKYEMLQEFYTVDHKLNAGNDAEKIEALDEQQEFIAYAMNPENPKTDMLFAYDGVKKIKHKKWNTQGSAYVVKDWTKIDRNLIGDEGDFTKEFTTVYAKTPEDGGTVVCSAEVAQRYLDALNPVIKDNLAAPNRSYWTEQEVMQEIEKATFFKLKNTESQYYVNYTTPSEYVQGYVGSELRKYYTGPVAINGNSMRHQKIEKDRNGREVEYHTCTLENDTNLYGSVKINIGHIETDDNVSILGHYEDTSDAPYLVMDTFKRIQLSPWFVNCSTGSLEAAVTKAKLLVDMIGIENVKIIKLVPFDQFVKIN